MTKLELAIASLNLSVSCKSNTKNSTCPFEDELTLFPVWAERPVIVICACV